ncbi:uncharacterized protein BKA78DRAFT_356630 [Phyllosticta capitalensis]|uniref:uncharacterized protein n=1 Tax=Phyllosticta capitalensis TaxID=121624 RepID=UPI003131B2C6
MSVQSIVHVTYGTGTHTETIPRENFVTIYKHWYAYQLVYPLALCLVKQSILVLYHRIFVHQRIRTWIKVVAYFVLIDTIITEIVNIFECSHPSRAWDVDDFPRGCINLEAAYFARSATAILTDFIILLMPLPMLARLQIPKRRRAAVIGMFLIGSLSLCASIARLIAIYNWSVSNDPSYTAIWKGNRDERHISVAFLAYQSVDQRKPDRLDGRDDFGNANFWNAVGGTTEFCCFE